MFRNLSSVTWSDNFCYPANGCVFSNSPGCPSDDDAADLGTSQGSSSNRSKLNDKVDRSVLGQGVYGGPMVLHDQQLRTMVVAPLDNFHRKCQDQDPRMPTRLAVMCAVPSTAHHSVPAKRAASTTM